MLAWLIHGDVAHSLSDAARYAFVLCAVLGFWNILYEVKALRIGLLKVYDQPWANGEQAAIALDYSPWFFGGFGAAYGAFITALELYAGATGPLGLTEILLLTICGLLSCIALPVLGFMHHSMNTHGHPAHSSRNQGTTVRTLLSSTLLVLALSLSAASLWAASHLDLGYALLAIWFFALVNNMPFALMHEAVHGVAADSRRINAFIGTLAGWAFPTSFSMQRIAHLGHHQRNRTDRELYDYYLPNQSRTVRNLWLYTGNLLGLYWWCVVFSNLVYAIAPGVLPLAVFCRSNCTCPRLLTLCQRTCRTAAHQCLG